MKHKMKVLLLYLKSKKKILYINNSTLEDIHLLFQPKKSYH